MKNLRGSQKQFRVSRTSMPHYLLKAKLLRERFEEIAVFDGPFHLIDKQAIALPYLGT